MKIVLFGATGMVGQGVLRECLLAGDVDEVLAVGRSGTGRQDAKLRELRLTDFTDYGGVDFSPYDACFFCLGVSSAGMSEADYRRVTYDYTLAAARVMERQRPGMTFVYVSGAGTNTTGRAMWAKVKGATEDALLAMDLRGYMFRPAFIRPLHGVRSRTRSYRIFYAVIGPLAALAVRFAPGIATTTEQLGRAMLRVARDGAPKRVLESRDIRALGDQETA